MKLLASNGFYWRGKNAEFGFGMEQGNMLWNGFVLTGEVTESESKAVQLLMGLHLGS